MTWPEAIYKSVELLVMGIVAIGVLYLLLKH